MLSRNIEDLARALRPEAAVPAPGWRERVEKARGEAIGLLSSADPADHLIAALRLTIAGEGRG